MNKGTLTDRNYWEQYYGGSSIDIDRVNRICGAYDNYWDILFNKCSSSSKPRHLVEIGGYPGRYLAYLADRYKCVPTSVDFNSDCSKLEELFKAFQIPEYHILQEDIFSFTITRQYDVVISLGFIEHFEDFDAVLDIHAKLLKQGGTMLVMVPNMRYLRKWYGKLLDNENLKAHNLKCMSKKVFNQFQRRNNLEEIYLEYWGGFAFNVHHRLNFVENLFYQPIRRFFKLINPFLSRYPSKYYSSSLIGIYKKP